MKVDLYTKAVLTVIAAALIYLCVAVTPTGVTVHAQENTVLSGWRDDQGNVHKLPSFDARDSPGSTRPLPVFNLR